MPTVNIDQDKLQDFIRMLRKFDRDLQGQWRALNVTWKNLEATWHDQEREKFLRDWQEVINAMEGYLSDAETYEQFLMRKDRALDAFLGR